MIMRVGADSEGVLAAMAEEVGQWCVRKGWRAEDDHLTPDTLGRTFGDEIALMHSELSEALEAYREFGLRSFYRGEDGEFTDAVAGPRGHLNKPEGVAVELADLLIRLLDTCHHLDIDLFEVFRIKMDYNETREVRHGGKSL